MKGKIFRQVMCVILALMMFGCKSAYDLTLYSTPSGVAVEVGQDIQGRTPCNLEIPRKSKLIQDHHINVKYILDDGREFLKSYDLRNYEPPGVDIGGFIGGCIAFPGMLLISLVSSDDDDDDKDRYTYKSYEEKKEEKKAEKEKNKACWIGAGFILTGGIINGIFGNHNKGKQYKYDIHETFDGVDASQSD
ncbi:MAG: hypothetical protein JXA96_08195 [Sedimentisphaerales bacterium]|nr:hypothetical protein [Sedimentisphaerales bacterium]